MSDIINKLGAILTGKFGIEPEEVEPERTFAELKCKVF